MSPTIPPTARTATDRTRAADAVDRTRALRICAAAWLLPGAGHFLLGQMRKAGVFFVVLLTMFAVGLASGGRPFPFQTSELLLLLAAVAQWVLLLPRILAAMGGLGHGDVIAATYEYGNTFLIVGGLLNALVILDAYDVAMGRKAQGGRS
jgi:hypothetical protein